MELRGLLKEKKSTECKERESTDASGNSSDGQAELRQTVETLQAGAKGHSKVTKLCKDKGEKISNEVSDGEIPVTMELIVSTTEELEHLQTKGQSHSQSARHVAKHGVSLFYEKNVKKHLITPLLEVRLSVFLISVLLVPTVGWCQISAPGPREAENGS